MGCNSSKSTGTVSNNGKGLTREEEEKMTQGFHLLDQNKDGYLDQLEVQRLVVMTFQMKGIPVDPELVNGTVRAFMRESDKNGDNKVSLQEFLQFFNNHNY